MYLLTGVPTIEHVAALLWKMSLQSSLKMHADKNSVSTVTLLLQSILPQLQSGSGLPAAKFGISALWGILSGALELTGSSNPASEAAGDALPKGVFKAGESILWGMRIETPQDGTRLREDILVSLNPTQPCKPDSTFQPGPQPKSEQRNLSPSLSMTTTQKPNTIPGPTISLEGV